MLYKILADIIVVLHFFFILFMLLGFILTFWGFFWEDFYDWWLFRTLHLLGIAYVGLLAALREYCPLTMLENFLRLRYDPCSTYPGSFIVHYIEKLVYPDVNPIILIIGTVIIAIFTLIIFILKPPTKIQKIFSCKENKI